MQDYCDGKAFTTHPLFSVKKNAIQMFLYYDEVEICNPLGSKVKTHKLGKCLAIQYFDNNFVIIIAGMFYFSLGNVQLKYRSKLSSIKLLCIVKSKHVSLYGMDRVLEPIVTDIKKMVCKLYNYNYS